MLRIRQTSITGCVELFPLVFEDARGRFIKSFHSEQFQSLGLRSDFVESFYSISHKHVVRGLHFQAPPHAHAKLVYCSNGAALDAVVDLRVGSPTYGKYETFDLSQTCANMIYLAPGLAHGFLTVSDSATLIYATTSLHDPEADSGIRWDSVNIPWPIDKPTISDRDASLEQFKDFISPFAWDG